MYKCCLSIPGPAKVKLTRDLIWPINVCLCHACLNAAKVLLLQINIAPVASSKITHVKDGQFEVMCFDDVAKRASGSRLMHVGFQDEGM